MNHLRHENSGMYSRLRVDPASGEVSVKDTLRTASSTRRAARSPGEPNEDWRETFRSSKPLTGSPDFASDPVYTDTHENPFAIPANRTKPPTHTVVMECESPERARALARSLVFAYSLDVEIEDEDSNLKAHGVLAPLPLMREVSRWVVSSEIEDLTPRQMLDYTEELDPAGLDSRTAIASANSLVPGTKVAVIADFPEMAYRYQPHAQEIVTVVEAGQKDGTILCESERWGLFYAEPDEIDHVTEVGDPFDGGGLFGPNDYR